MDKRRLLDTLEQLHFELSQAERVDPETLALLQTVTNDIERVINRRDEPSAADVKPVASGLKDLLSSFEAEHPQLSTAVGKVADALAAMGI